jgi:aminoglycoside 6'-N-acetyltransferase I
MTIRPAELPDLPALLPLRDALWPGAAGGEHRRELENMLTAKTFGPYPCVVLIADAGEGSVAGFVEVGLRSHADGCDPDHPVGYLEGWFVAAAWRGQGAGRALVEAAEEWARSQGCREMASDTWIDNTGSQRAHEALGYEVVDRCVNYRKRLSAP